MEFPFGDRPIRLGILGMTEGNAHPFSWSAIINGYDREEMQRWTGALYPTIPQYLNRQPKDTFGFPGVKVTHVCFTGYEDRAMAENCARAARIPHVCDRPEEMIGQVDAVILGCTHFPVYKEAFEKILGCPAYDSNQMMLNSVSEGKGNPVEISKNACEYAKANGFDYIIVDTAGRLHIDDNLMDELKNITGNIKPHETLLVIDSMMGQDAINVITGFNDALKLTGVILTKLDGDTRGGVALSVRHLTNIPIKFIGVSEKMDGLSEFHPDRMANRIIGMGDVISLVEKVESEIDEKEAMKAAKKMTSGKFDLEDFLAQLNQIKKLGPLENLLKLLPGAKKMGLADAKIDPKQMAHVEAIVLSMTPEERHNPDIIKASRKQRIAKGCGLTVTDVNKLLSQFEEMKKMMKMLGNNKNFKLPF